VSRGLPQARGVVWRELRREPRERSVMRSIGDFDAGATR